MREKRTEWALARDVCLLVVSVLGATGLPQGAVAQESCGLVVEFPNDVDVSIGASLAVELMGTGCSPRVVAPSELSYGISQLWGRLGSESVLVPGALTLGEEEAVAATRDLAAMGLGSAWLVRAVRFPSGELVLRFISLGPVLCERDVLLPQTILPTARRITEEVQAFFQSCRAQGGGQQPHAATDVIDQIEAPVESDVPTDSAGANTEMQLQPTPTQPTDQLAWVPPALLFGASAFGFGLGLYASLDATCEQQSATGRCLAGDQPNYAVGVTLMTLSGITAVGSLLWLLAGSSQVSPGAPALDQNFQVDVGPSSVTLRGRF